MSVLLVGYQPCAYIFEPSRPVPKIRHFRCLGFFVTCSLSCIYFKNALVLGCDPIARPAVNWRSCYNAWEKMHDDLPTATQQNLHFLARYVRPYGPAGTITTPIRWLSDDGTCAIDLKMEAERAPSGQRDIGDDAYGNSILEAARHVLDTCVRGTNRGGWVKKFSTTHRLGITFSSYASRLPTINCDTVAPSPPLDQPFKDKVTRALYALPTNEKVSTTFNRTRAPGPAGTSAVMYLLPRREPAAEPPPVLRVDMLGNQVTTSSMWEVWTAGVAVNTLCVQNGRQGRAVGIGRDQKIGVLISRNA
ncbi:hypothetical protein XPA_002693 [Xanthoria parietina]